MRFSDKRVSLWIFVGLFFILSLSLWGDVVIDDLTKMNYLDGEWKFLRSDQADFKGPQWDDSAWESVEFPVSGFPFLQEESKSDYTWFRKRVVFDPALKGSLVGFFAGSLAEASQVYFNGTLIAATGGMPPEEYFRTSFVPHAFAIPSDLIRYGESNLFAIRTYSKAVGGNYNNLILGSDFIIKRHYFSKYFTSILIGALTGLFAVFIFFYFIIMYGYNRKIKFNLYLAVGSILYGLYAFGSFLEFPPFSFFHFYIITEMLIRLSIAFYLLAVQEFYRIHNSSIIKIVVLSLVTAASIFQFFQPDFMAVDSYNTTLYLGLVVPMIFYILGIAIYRCIKRPDKYGFILFAGVFLLIATAVHDLVFDISGNIPDMWLSTIGSFLFNVSLFVIVAVRFMEIKKDSEHKAVKLAEKNRSLKKIMDDITGVSRQLSTCGSQLGESVENTSTAANQLQASNQNVAANIGSQLQKVEENNKAINNILTSVDVLVAAVEEQAAYVEENSSAITEISVSLQSVYSSTRKADEITRELSQLAEAGTHSASKASGAIKEIEESSRAVLNVVDVINDISARTNLLAMNAAIEAAHAGSFGRGFAIVAGEVRKLAVDSANNVKIIVDHINGMYKKIENGVANFKKLDIALDNIMKGIGSTSRLIQEINNATKEQSQGAAEIATSINSLVNATNNVRSSIYQQQEGSQVIIASLDHFKEISQNITNSIVDQSSAGAEILNTVEKDKDISLRTHDAVSSLEVLVDSIEHEEVEDASEELFV